METPRADRTSASHPAAARRGQASPRAARPPHSKRSPKVEEELLTLGDLQLTLKQKILTAKGDGGEVQRIRLATAHPCQFHRDPAGAVRVVQRGEHLIVLVECSRPKNDTDCDTHIRSVRVAGKKMKLSPKQQHVAGCPPMQWDEYMFAWFWHLPPPDKNLTHKPQE